GVDGNQKAVQYDSGKFPARPDYQDEIFDHLSSLPFNVNKKDSMNNTCPHKAIRAIRGMSGMHLLHGEKPLARAE
ncbi:MAG TPA: hypothetical protein VLL97_01095, partial [Acidobacteriota bacterium]|nr:hypothetical protein [Acidobacteriota bacterium]